MSGKQYLYSLKELDREIRDKIDRLDELKAIAISITASTDKESIQTSSDKDRLGAIMTKVIDAEKEINKMTDKYIGMKKNATRIIFSLPIENHQNVLYDYFILNEKLSKVAEDNGWRYDNCKKLRKLAIKEFEKRFSTTSCGVQNIKIQNIENDT